MSIVSGKKAKKKVAAANPIARWGTYETWKLTADQIHLFDEIRVTREWVDKSTKQKRYKDGKKTKTKSVTVKAHKSPIEFDFTFSLYKDFFSKIDIAAQIRRWNSLVGKSASFYVGTTALAAARKYQLTRVDISGIEQVRGIITACTVKLHFRMTSKGVEKSEKKQRAKEIKSQPSKKKGKAKGSAGYNALAVAACRLSYSRPARHNPHTNANPGTKVYRRVYGNILGKSDTRRRAPKVYNVGGRSCDRGVATSVLWSGYDDGMHRTCGSIHDHMKSSSRWRDLGHWNGRTSSLKPGDVLIRLKKWHGVSGNHVCMYVGADTAQYVYDTYLKGTDADKGRPASDACFMSSHLAGGKPPDKGHAPCIGNAKYAHADRKMKVFRCTNPQGSKRYAKT